MQIYQNLTAKRFLAEIPILRPEAIENYCELGETGIYTKASKPHGEEIFSRNFRSSTRSNRKLLRAGKNGDLCKDIKAARRRDF